LSSWDIIVPGLDWIGIDNYIRLFTDDSRYWEALVRLIFFSSVTVFLQYVIGFTLAHLVWKEVVLKRFLRVLFLIPMMTTPVIMTVIWRTIFHESLGPVNDILSNFGVTYIPWLTDESWGKLSVITVEVWQWTPFMFLLLLAGLLSLPKEPYLAAAIDGAGPVRTFFYVTFPLMAPISIGAIIIRVIEASKILDTVYVLTSGGPGTATETSSFYIYIKGLREFQLGYSATMSFTYLIIMIISLTIIAKLLHRLLIKT
jgi:multiple sugar transport system permease protein